MKRKALKTYEKNGFTEGQYVGIHQWVRRNFTRPETCEHCGKTEKEVYRFDWANISGYYLKERSDWLNLCMSCHQIMDKHKSHCVNGQEYTPENSMISHKGVRRCRECNRLHTLLYKSRRPDFFKARHRVYQANYLKRKALAK